MLVSKKHKIRAPKIAHSFPELLHRRYSVAFIDMEAIFYSRASSDTELLAAEDYVDETGIVLFKRGKS